MGEKGQISSCPVEGTKLSFNERTGNIEAGKGLRAV